MIRENEINLIIEYLEGTINSLDTACEIYGLDGEDNLTKEEFKYIDEHIYCCSNCGWWKEIGDNDEDNNCEDCQNDMREE